MAGNCVQVEKDEAGEIKRVLNNLIRHRLEVVAKVATEFQLKRLTVKTRRGIYPGICNKKFPFTDHWDKER